MLTHLLISNYALIDNLEIDFKKGLTIITGETGAGKSIILGALSLILGERADLKVIRNTEKKSVIEATFGIEEYKEIDAYCKEKGIIWFASCWDEQSVDFIDQFDVPCYKIASASLTDDNLLKHTRAKGKPILLSTGMSTIEEIKHAVDVLGKEDLIIYHCTSTYPSNADETNLNAINEFKKIFDCPIGYSGHERGVTPSVLAVALGACSVERHITVDRTNWGSDQAASLEIAGLSHMVRDIRQVPALLGDGVKIVYPREIPIIDKLRRVK